MHFAMGVRGHSPPPRENFEIVQFGVYLDQILSSKFFKNYHFLYKIFKKYHFLYKKNKFLDTWGNSMG